MGNEADLPTLPMSGDVTRTDGAGAATYGRFVSLGVIGRGGMGLVLRARDPVLDRDVAIKLLAPTPLPESDPASAQRLEREAQAMAKLSHPNVVTVYEMGQVGNARFIAMELVEGSTLRRWLADRARPWREVVAVFAACGRGLAAAHAAGLVHRDFKPENVLIGADGRPRVTDFGLVATGVAVEGSDLGDASPVSDLTVRGAVVGTPMYMAPEQWAGQEVDARGDQFAFCVALWEAVYGERPFAGASGHEVRDRVLAGDLRGPPRHPKVGRWLEPILRRGLARDRAARWPSMAELLAALDRPRRRWPWVVGGLGVAVVAFATVLVLTPRAATDPCPDPRPRLAGIWDRAVRDRLVADFIAQNPAIGEDVSRRVLPALDRYSDTWRSASLEACRATKVEGTQSAELLDLRMVCLERRRAELGALTAALATADRARVANAVDAVGALGDLARCADRETLLAFPPPTDAGQRRQVDALEAEVAASSASRFAGKPHERLARARAVLAAARAAGYVPLRVRALEETVHAAFDVSAFDATIALLRELAGTAAEAHDDRLAAEAWVSLVKLLAQQHQLDEARALEPVAEAAVARAGAPARLRVRLLIARGTRLMHAQELAASVDALREAVALAADEAERSTAQLALAQVLFRKDGPASALPVAEAALATTEALYGPRHPLTADAVHLVAEALIASGELDRALAAETRVLAIREAALGPAHREVAIALHALGNIAKQRDDHPAARTYYQRAITIFDTERRQDDAALSRGMLAGIVADDDGLTAARPIYVAALDALAATLGADHLEYAQIAGSFAQRLIDAGRCDEALPHLDHAAVVMATVSPRDLPIVLETAAGCDLAAHRTDRAIARLEQSRVVCAASGCPYPEDTTWLLGKTLVESRRDRRGGMAMVAEAARLAVEHESPEVLAEIDAWRKTHR